MAYINKINVGGVLYDVQDLEASTAVPQIKQMISNAESSPATAAHAAGSYLIYNNTLYRASAAIAIGDTLTVGTNIDEVTDGLAEDVAELSGEVTDLKSAVEQTQNIIDTKAPAIYETISAPMASFRDGADDMPLKQCVVQIEPVQEGDGDPSPENIRPISGWTGATVTRAGLNLFGGMLMRDGVQHCIQAAVDHPDEKYITFGAAAAAVPGGFTALCGLTGRFKENTAYTFILTISKNSGTGSNMRIWYTDGTGVNIPQVSAPDTKETIIFVTSANKTVYRFGKTNSSGATSLYYNESGIFEGNLTAEDFVPYNGDSYPVTFPAEAGTVYRGYIDLVNGKLVVDALLRSLNSFSWSYYASAGYFRTPALTTSSGEPIAAEAYLAQKTISSSSPDLTCGRQSGGNRLAIKDSKYNGDVTEWLTAVGDTNVLIPLDTPIEYAINPTKISTLFGVNNIFADAGPVSVEYPADTKLYIDGQNRATRSLIAGIESDMTASKAYSAGDLLIVSDTLYKAASPIANGETLTPGTNVTATTVAEQLLLLANA